MGAKVSCRIYNDTKYPVKIDNYFENQYLEPGDIQGIWLYESGNYYVDLIITLPHGEESVRLRNSEYGNRTYRMSDFFRDKLHKYEEEERRKEAARSKQEFIQRRKKKLAQQNALHLELAMAREAERLKQQRLREEAERQKQQRLREEAERQKQQRLREEAERQKQQRLREEAERQKQQRLREEAERLKQQRLCEEAERQKQWFREVAVRQKQQRLHEEAERLKQQRLREEAERQKQQRLREEAERQKQQRLREEAERQKQQSLREEAERQKLQRFREEAERQKQQRLREEAERQKQQRLREEARLAEEERQIERKKLEDLEREIERKHQEEERVLNKFKNNMIGDVKCSTLEYADRVSRSKEITLQSKFSHQLTPLKMQNIPDISEEEAYQCTLLELFESELSSYDSELLPLSADQKSDHSMPHSTLKRELFELIRVMETTNKDREWLMNAQTFLLFYFAQKEGLVETQLDKLLYSLSFSASLNDHQFLKLTKALACLCMISSKEDFENYALKPYYLRVLVCCSGITKGYLKGTFVNATILNDEELLQFVPLLSEGSFECLVAIILPSTLTSLDSSQLKQLNNRIQTHQLSLDCVKNEIIGNFANPYRIINGLQKVAKGKFDKSLEELIEELAFSSLLSKSMLMTIMKALKFNISEKIDVVRAKDALIRLTDKRSSVVVRDLAWAVSCLSSAVIAYMKYKPRLTQLISLCILLLSKRKEKNRLLEVSTGEGKSCIIAMLAAALALQGKKVDIVTSSPVLAKRDASKWAKFYEIFGFSATHNTDTMEMLTTVKSEVDKEKCDSVYGCHIVYGTVSSFSADILREEFEMRKVRGNRGFQVAIIDEMDMLMMDEGVQFTYLSHRVALLRHLEPVLAIVWCAVQQHSPLPTEDGDILYADVPKNFQSVLRNEVLEHPKLQEKLEYIHQLPNNEKKEAIVSFIEEINTSGASCIKRYSIGEGSNKLVSTSEQNVQEDHNMSLLVSDDGIVHQLYTQESLADGVQNVVLDQCDVTKEEVFLTTDGDMYLSGSPGAFDEVLNDLSQGAIQWDVIEQDEDMRGKILEDKSISSAVSLLQKLSAHQSEINIVGYVLNECNKLKQVKNCGEHRDRSMNSVIVLIKDEGLLCPLCSIIEANTNQEEVLYTADGIAFNRGAPDFLNKVIYPLCLLHFLAGKGISSNKIKNFLGANDAEAKEAAINNFCMADMFQILEFLSRYLPYGIIAYTSAPGHSKRLVSALKLKADCENQISVLIKDGGKLCMLNETHNEKESFLSPEGSTFSQGLEDSFSNVICTVVDSSSLFHLFTKRDSKYNTKKKIDNDDVLGSLLQWEKFLPFKLVVYSICGNIDKQFGPVRSKSEIPVLLDDGMLCQLHKKEKLAIPSCLKDFVLNQLPTYVDSAFTAHLMTENREYLVSEGSQIVPIDFENSGVIEANKKWGGGLQQMLEMKHHLQLSPMSVITNFLSHIGFFQRYKKGTLFGLSGTIGGDSDFEVLKKLYSFKPCRVPTFRKKLLYERDPVFVKGERKDWLCKIHSVVKDIVGQQSNTAPGGAALVLCEDICTAEEIHKDLEMKGLTADLYTRDDLEGSKSLEDTPRESGDIIIATNLAGRGTDIKLSDGVLSSGGLFCLLTFLPRNRRVELQAFGRTARQGNPGSVQLVLPAFADHLEIGAIRRTRERTETVRLKNMIETDIQEVLLRENLFCKHCKFLKRLYSELEGRQDTQMIIDTMNENWGQWLQTKQQDIMCKRKQYLLKELECAHKRWRPYNCDALLQHLPECNFHHLVEFGNKQLFKREDKLNKKSCITDSCLYYTEAIRMESKFTMVAYYNRACSKLAVAKGDYKPESIADLTTAKELLKIYKAEISTVTQCASIGARRSVEHEGENFLRKQMETRMQIIQYFESQIEETIKKIKELKDEDIEVVPSSILQFIPEADIITNEELYSLKLLGLEAAFSVKKKAKFSWLALGVFLLGVGQIVVGACLAVLTVGTLSSVGMGLIAEGVSDCIDGVVGMVTGEFDLKDWAISKACSIGLSLACGGAGKLIAKGAKAAYKGAKVAYKGAKGVRSGVKAAAKSVKVSAESAKAAAKGGVKAVGKDVQMMGKVAKGSWGKSLKSNMTEVGKLVGKELVSQGAMYGLNKLENLAIEKIFDCIGKKIAHSIQESLGKSFISSDKNDLGQFVDSQYHSEWQSSTLELKIQQFFKSVTDDVVQTFIHTNSAIFEKLSETFRDKILPGLSERLKGKAAILATVVELGFVADSIDTTVTQLSRLTKDFQPEMVKQCTAKLQECSPASVQVDYVRKLKLKLAKQTADKYGETVSTVLQQNLTWMLNRGMSKTLNNVAGGYVNKKLDLDGTKDQVTAIGQSNYVAYMPPRSSEHADVQHMKSISDKIRDPDTTGTLAELKVAVEKFNCKVVIEDHGGNKIRSLESHSGHENTITLVHFPKSDKHPNGHYDVKINGEIISVRSEGNSCMFEALALGLKKDGHSEHDAQSVRNTVAEEISKNPEKWHDHFERKDQLEKIKRGHLHLLEGGAVNESTAVKEGTYVNVLGRNVNIIEYEQDNHLHLTSHVFFNTTPKGNDSVRYTPHLSGQDTFTRVTNDVNMTRMAVSAANCSFARNIGRCKYTLPSFKQISFREGLRPTDDSAPVSFHLIPSEAGANAGEHFGNSVVASEYYNKLERKTCDEIKKYVGDKDFYCTVNVELENLIPSRGGIEKFVRDRNQHIIDDQMDRECISLTKSGQRNENINKLKERFEEVGRIGSQGVNIEPGEVPQVQRIKSLTYIVKMRNGNYKEFPMGRDTELYVHSLLTGNTSGYNNRDLVGAVPSRKQKSMGLIP